jgi:hypothetical protein
MAWHTRAYSAQFHIEVEADTVQNWNGISQYSNALEKALGENGAIHLQAACAGEMQNFGAMAERFYINWLQATSAA